MTSYCNNSSRQLATACHQGCHSVFTHEAAPVYVPSLTLMPPYHSARAKALRKAKYEKPMRRPLNRPLLMPASMGFFRLNLYRSTVRSSPLNDSTVLTAASASEAMPLACPYAALCSLAILVTKMDKTAPTMRRTGSTAKTTSVTSQALAKAACPHSAVKGQADLLQTKAMCADGRLRR